MYTKHFSQLFPDLIIHFGESEEKLWTVRYQLRMFKKTFFFNNQTICLA